MHIRQSTTKALGLFIINGQLERQPVCPKLFKWRQDHDMSSSAMLFGKYGETKLIGGGRGGEETHDLPRKKNGDKRIAHARLDEQIPKARQFMSEMQIQANKWNTQVRLFSSKLGVSVGGELDIFPTPVYGGTYDMHGNGELFTIPPNACSVVDVKFSQDIYNDYYSVRKPELSSYCWGAIHSLNINQALFYHWLIRNAEYQELIQNNPEDKIKYDFIYSDLVQRNIKNALFYYFVIGFGKPAILKNEQIMLHPVEWNDANEKLFHYLLNESVALYSSFEESGWEERKIDMKKCDECPVRASSACKFY